MDYTVDFSKYGKKFLCADRVTFSEDEAKILVKELFGQLKRNDIKNTLERNDLPTDDKTVDHIAENLFEEITEHDEMYWELEDKNILFLCPESFKVTVHFLNGSVKEYSRTGFVETYNSDTVKYKDDALDGAEEPMTGKDWAQLIGSSDADNFDNVELYEVQTYRLLLTSNRDVDHTVEVEAASEDEAIRIGFGIDSGYGFPDEVVIID